MNKEHQEIIVRAILEGKEIVVNPDNYDIIKAAIPNQVKELAMPCCNIRKSPLCPKDQLYILDPNAYPELCPKTPQDILVSDPAPAPGNGSVSHEQPHEGPSTT